VGRVQRASSKTAVPTNQVVNNYYFINCRDVGVGAADQEKKPKPSLPGARLKKLASWLKSARVGLIAVALALWPWSKP
jgi:hypothetical protein